MTVFRYGDSVLGHYDDPERERVAVLAASFGPSTFGVLEELGVGPAWRCLDAGAGNGSVARWLAGRVEPGAVLAVDQDVRFFGAASEPNLVIKELDLVTGDLPEAAFDLVFARLVLLHLPEREAVLDKLCRAVAAGGYLMIAEGVADLGLASAHPEMRAMWQAITEVLTTTLATSFTWVRALPGRLADLGLTDIAIKADTPLIKGGGAHARCCQLTLDAASGLAAERGILDSQALAQIAARLQDPDFIDLGITMIYTWGRKPASP